MGLNGAGEMTADLAIVERVDVLPGTDIVEMPERWLSLYANQGQLESLEPYIAAWEHGGTLTDRTLEFARSGDTLIVWKLDRLARSMKQLIETIENLRMRGIGFRSLTEALDTTTAQGWLVFHMFGALAEFERGLIRERTQAGLTAARRLGCNGGRLPKLTDHDIEAKALLANPDAP